MKLLKDYMPLSEGETVVKVLEGNAYNLSSNIVLRILGFFIKIMSLICGVRRKVHIVVTNKRVITVETQKILWFIDGSIKSRSYTARSISQVGYALQRDLLVFKSHYLEFISGSSAYLIKAKEGRDKVYEMITDLATLTESVKASA